MSWGFGANPVACIIIGYKTGGYFVQPIHNPVASCFQPYENIEPDTNGEDIHNSGPEKDGFDPKEELSMGHDGSIAKPSTSHLKNGWQLIFLIKFFRLLV